MKMAFMLGGVWYACYAYTYGETFRAFRKSAHWEAGDSIEDYIRAEGLTPVPDSDGLYFLSAWSVDEATANEVCRDL